MTAILNKLYSLGAIKFGQYEISKDFVSPFQVDLSSIISTPDVAKEICKLIWEKARNLSFDLICGTPTIGACFANFISWEYEFPMVMRRIENREGIKILGKYKSGQKCLLIQDLQLFGQHTLDLIDDLDSEGIEVQDVLAFIDLELGGKKKIKSRGFTPHSVFGMKEVMEILHEQGKVPGDHFKLASDFLENV